MSGGRGMREMSRLDIDRQQQTENRKQEERERKDIQLGRNRGTKEGGTGCGEKEGRSSYRRQRDVLE